MIENVVEIALPVDETFRIRKNRIKNGNGEKRFSLVTGVHGDELEGQYCAYTLISFLKENLDKIDGIIDIYSGMNPLGIDSILRGIPAFDLDMNRIFPGRDDGDMNEYIAKCIVDDITGSDLVMDIHASNIFLEEVPQIRINEISKERLIPWAKKANVDFIWVSPNATVLESTLAYSLNSRNTDTLVVEMGVGMRITKSYGDQLVSGIKYLLKEMGIFKGDVETPRKAIISDSLDKVIFLNAPSSGIFINTAKHGALIKEGEEIGRIVDPLTGEDKDIIVSSVSGWLFTLREYPVVGQGSLMARILTVDEEERKTIEGYGK